jgi:hypothetical protein
VVGIRHHDHQSIIVPAVEAQDFLDIMEKTLGEQSGFSYEDKENERGAILLLYWTAHESYFTYYFELRPYFVKDSICTRTANNTEFYIAPL